MLVRRDQILTAPGVGIDLVGADRPALGAVLDRGVDLEQPAKAEIPLDGVLLGVGHFDLGDRLIATQRCAEIPVELEAMADPPAGAIRPGEDAVRAPDLDRDDLGPPAELVDEAPGELW